MQPTLEQWLARKPKGKAPRKRIRKVSKRRAPQNREYTLRRRAYLLEHPYCEAHKIICEWLWDNDRVAWERAPFGYDGHGPDAEEIHHKKKPKCKYLNDESTWLAVAAWSHRWIEDHKRDARLIGLLD